MTPLNTTQNQHSVMTILQEIYSIGLGAILTVRAALFGEEWLLVRPLAQESC